MPAGEHNASGSMVGYLYQVHWGLLELLKRGPERPDFAISLELHDDVAWELNGSPQELLQTKHHLNSNSGLGDKDVDLWKTLLVWINTAQPGDRHGPQLFLVSTSIAADDSAAGLLRPDDRRDEASARGRLDAAATGSTNRDTQKARTGYLALTPAQREVFVERIHVLDGAPRVANIDEAVRRVLWSALPSDHEDMFMALVWKWWTAAALDMLQGRRASISASESRGAISGIRDRFGDDHLPTTVELSDVDQAAVVTSHENRPFVHQMRWVKYNNTNLHKAIVDYHRAVTQTVEWVADDIIGLHELQRFEDNLRDEWQRHFADMEEDLGDNASDEDQIAAGKKLLRELRESTAVNVRPKYNESFFARGKRQELADQGKMGWHPSFERLMEQLMMSAATSSTVDN